MLEHALQPAAAEAVKIGVAGHNLFDVAYAWLLAEERGVTDRIEFEMLLGMATGQAEAVKRTVGGLLLFLLLHGSGSGVGLGFHHVARVVVLIADHHHLADAHGYVEAVLILYQYDVLTLEARYATASHFTQKSYLISYLHML
jgi:hypothetical protein